MNSSSSLTNATGSALTAGVRSLTRQDLWAALTIAGLLILMIGLTWQRWTQPIIDHGREANLPARILSGDQLYLDVQFLYGPFAPYFNALLYRIFGIHLATLHASGFACAVMILVMIYWLARQLMSALEAALAAGLVLVLCVVNIDGNYIQPYAYAALYGLIFALGSLVCTVHYIQLGSTRSIFWAGLFAGFALISKQELAAAALTAAVVALAIKSVTERRPRWRDTIFCAVPVIGLSLGAYGWILRRVPWRTLVDFNHIFFTNLTPQLIYFNGHVSGLNEWPKSFWYSLTGIGMLGIWVGLSLLLGALFSVRGKAEWRVVARRGLWIGILGFVWWKSILEFFRVHTDATPLTAALFVLPVMVWLLAWRLWRTRSKSQSAELAVLLVISVFALVSITRVFLNVTGSGPYSPFFLPTLSIAYIYLLFRVSPAYFAQTGLLRANIRRAAMVLVVVAIILVGRGSSHLFRGYYRHKIDEPRASFLVEPKIGPPMAAAIRYAREHTAPEDYVLVLPQGTMINFLAERRNPLREEIVHPGFLEDENEEDAVHRILTRRVPLILIDNILTPEMRDQAFGVDFNQGLLKWIEEHYRLTARFGPISGREVRLGDTEFFILAYELKK